MVSFVANFNSTPLSEVLKMPSIEIFERYNTSVELYNFLNRTE